MLSHLRIENIALIGQLSIDLEKGLNIITGETGAGKSIVIDSINLLLGERADRNLIRAGEDKAYVEGIFTIENMDVLSPTLDNYGIIVDDETLIITRELSSNGRNICRINGRAVTLSVLKEVSKYLIDIHGQHEHQSLLSVESHRKFLDSFGGNSIEERKEEVRKYYNIFKNVQNQIESIQEIDASGRARKDYLIYQLEEIKKANLKIDEYEKLMQERTVLQNSEHIMEGIEKVYNLLYRGWSSSIPSITEGLGSICSEFQNLVNLDKELEPMLRRFENIYYELEDCVMELRDYMDTFKFDENKLDEIESRLNLINDLKRKYGSSISDILEYSQELEKEIRKIEESNQLLAELSSQRELTWEKLYSACESLSKKRKEVAKRFEVQLLRQLSDLGMDKTKFLVDINSDRKYVSSDGFDSIEFLISPNPGEPLRPLTKIVSGGEMARIMLAFKTILADIDDIPTLIFDEIDVGISGNIAKVVAQKMAIISKSHQLICVTHLPQIAAMADRHFTIEKYTDNGRTYTIAKVLSDGERQYELAKMAGGTELSKLSLEHALELIKNSEKYKSRL